MSMLVNVVLAVQILSALGMIGLILIQHGKGADMGAAFGSGSSGSLFGASGSANFLSRTTAVLAAVFFVATLALAYLATRVRSVQAACLTALLSRSLHLRSKLALLPAFQAATLCLLYRTFLHRLLCLSRLSLERGKFLQNNRSELGKHSEIRVFTG